MRIFIIVDKKRKKRDFAIAFGGGGARGIAHVGVLEVLEREKRLLPGIVSGTSVGAIIAACYASQTDSQSIHEVIDGFDWFENVVNLNETLRYRLRNHGLVSNDKLKDTMEELIGKVGFEDLPIDLAVVAADLEKKVRIVFTSPRIASGMERAVMEKFLPSPREGLPGCKTEIISDCEVAQAVQASCAVPAFFYPVKAFGYKILDGGVLNQIPVDVAKAMGADITMGVSLGLPFYPQRIRGAASIMGARIGLEGVHQQRKSLDMADLGFQIEGIEETSFLRTDKERLIGLGETAMEKRLEILKKLLSEKKPRRSLLN